MADKLSAGASGRGKKRKASDDSASGRKHQAILMETKVAIITKLDSGEKMDNEAIDHKNNLQEDGSYHRTCE